MNYDINIDSYIGYPISKAWVRSELATFKGRPVTVRINSYGGDVQTALDIRQQFLDHGNVTAYIFGMTASAATILAMGAKSIKMSRYALMLIHRCSGWSNVWGQMNAEELEQAIKELKDQKADLETIDHVIGSLYAERSHQKPADIAAVMKRAAWLSADECLSLGLIDEIVEDGDPATITDSVRHQFAACGLPLPHLKDSSNSNNSKTKTSNMNKQTFPLIMAMLAIESIATDDDGTCKLSTEQMTALEAKFAAAADDKKKADTAASAAEEKAKADASKLAELEAAKAELEKAKAELEAQVKALTEQVENLKKADGDHSDDINAQGGTPAATTAAEMFNRIKAAL